MNYVLVFGIADINGLYLGRCLVAVPYTSSCPEFFRWLRVYLDTNGFEAACTWRLKWLDYALLLDTIEESVFNGVL